MMNVRFYTFFVVLISALAVTTARALAGDCASPDDCGALPDNVTRVGGITGTIAGLIYICTKWIRTSPPVVEPPPPGTREKPPGDPPPGTREKPPGDPPPGTQEKPPGDPPPGTQEKPPGDPPPGTQEKPPDNPPPPDSGTVMPE